MNIVETKPSNSRLYSRNHIPSNHIQIPSNCRCFPVSFSRQIKSRLHHKAQTTQTNATETYIIRKLRRAGKMLTVKTRSRTIALSSPIADKKFKIDFETCSFSHRDKREGQTEHSKARRLPHKWTQVRATDPSNILNFVTCSTFRRFFFLFNQFSR